MSAHDAREQLFLELINRARMDPLGEAARYGIDLNAGLAPGTISSAPKEILAWNSMLETASQSHSQWQLNNNIFAHEGPVGNYEPWDRMANAGYNSAYAGENIAWSGSTGAYNADAAVLAQHRSLFLSEGHRENTLDPGFDEVGIAQATGAFQGYANSMVTTQGFATRGLGLVFVGGVSYTDSNGDDFYSIGEANGSRTVQLFKNGSLLTSTTTAAAGGYTLETLQTGAVELVYSGGGLSANNGYGFVLGSINAKVDLVDSNTIEANITGNLTQSALNLRLLGISDINGTGNALGNTLWGNKGNNLLDGAGGNDIIDGGDGTDTLVGGGGNDNLIGGLGTDTAIFTGNMSTYAFNLAAGVYTIYNPDGSIDTASGVENFQFADGTRTAAQLPITVGAPVRAVTITAVDVTKAEGNAGTTSFTFQVTLNGAAFSAQTVNYTVAGSGVNAANSADFSGALSGTISFAQGETTKTITVQVAGDTTFEQNEAFTVALSAQSSGLSLAVSAATSTINNDDAGMVVWNGTAGYDYFAGTNANDHVLGFAANDSLYGAIGDDVIEGGAGGDYMDGGNGTDFASYATSTVGVRVDIDYRSGNTGDAYEDAFVSIEGLIGSAFDDILYTTEFNDTVRGGTGADLIWTRGGDDKLEGGAGNDSMYGREANDVLDGGSGADYMDGGDGFDLVSYASSTAGVRVDTVYRSGNTGDAVEDSFVGLEGVIGSGFNDTIYTTDSDDTIDGGDGIDLIWARAGNDTLKGGTGNDSLYGVDGNDSLDGGAGADYLDGGNNSDTASYASATSAVQVDMTSMATNTGDAAGDGFNLIENISGSSFNDRLLGDDTDNVLSGLDGDDMLWARGGNDTLRGGAGNDTIYGLAGLDTLEGGTGNDTLDGGTGGDTYLFAAAAFGVDTIAQWDDGSDKISLAGSGLTFGSFAVQQSGANTLLTLNSAPSNTITIFNVLASNITGADFV